MPFSPVQALACPELITIARISSLSAKFFWEHKTGAALKRLVVKQPAATVFCSHKTKDKSFLGKFFSLKSALATASENPLGSVCLYIGVYQFEFCESVALAIFLLSSTAGWS